MTILFIAGPSGAGKTTLGNNLHDKYGWNHFDCELMFNQNPLAFIEDPLYGLDIHGRTVFTWGFIPEFMDTVSEILQKTNPYRVWLTAPVQSLDKSLYERDGKACYIDSDDKALTVDVLNFFDPDIIINAFNNSGERKDTAFMLNKIFTNPNGGGLK
jgi:hypothetical protein